MANETQAIVATLLESIETAETHARPYRHWILTGCLPERVTDALLALPFPAPALGGISGKREVHNATRKYFDAANRQAFPVIESFAQAFQSRTVTDRIQRHFGARLAGTSLRLEYAQDTDGFWLEPHTDLGVKAFTMLLYLSREPEHGNLGTDIYDADKKQVARSPFVAGGAMVFVPSSDTYHGFEPRPIAGVRKSIIINYVSPEWRAREQLSFPEHPIVA